MLRIGLIVIIMTVFVLSCSTTQNTQGEKSVLEKEVELIKQDTKDKEVVAIIKLFELKQKYGNDVDKYIDEYFNTFYTTYQKHALDTFKESPNKDLKVPSGSSQLHIKNNYPSGNTLIFVLQNGTPVVKELFTFNSEKKLNLNPGNYEFVLIIDRKFNTNKFVFTSPLNMHDGSIYLGEFNIKSSYNKAGTCPQKEVVDADMCIAVEFKILDNCPSGSHLVEDLCCEEGFNFIMDGKCSRYSGTAVNVLCPAGYNEAGQGRCCPNGMLFIDGSCQKPAAPVKEEKKDEKKDGKKKDKEPAKENAAE